MSDIYIVVKIEYYLQEIFSERLEKIDVKIFTDEEGAEEFLIDNGFVYGCPFPFKITGWYYSSNINTAAHLMNRFVFARIEREQINDDSYYRDKLSSYIFGPKNE